MIEANSHCKWYLTAVLAFAVGAAIQLQAQPGPGGFGGFGGFGGGGGGFGNRSRSSTSTQYPRNGDVGSAVISMDQDGHNLVVIADEETIAQISGVVSNLDRPQPQVLIKVVFLEVERNKGLDLGVDGTFRATTGYSPTTTTATNYSLINGGTTNSSIVPSFLGPVTSVLPSSFLTGSNLTGGGLLSGLQSSPSGLYTIMGQDYTVTLRALATASNGKVLSRPSVIARNNQPATILVGQSVPLITSVRYDTLGNVINGVQYTDVGIILHVTPFITPDGLVQMILNPEISKVAATGGQVISSGPGGLNPVTAPAIDKRSADTVVVTTNHQTVIIGGLIQDSKAEAESKIPFLGDIPLLGNLFKRKITSDGKTELLIFLTPHIIQTPTEVASLTTSEKARSEGVKAFSEKELDKFLDTLPTKAPKGNGKKPAKSKASPPEGSN